MKTISLILLLFTLFIPSISSAQWNGPEKCNDELLENPLRHVIANQMLESVDQDALDFEPHEAVINILSYAMDFRKNQCGMQEQVTVVIFQFEIWRLQMNYAQQLIDEEYYQDRLVAWRGYRDNFLVPYYCAKFTIACDDNGVIPGAEFLDKVAVDEENS